MEEFLGGMSRWLCGQCFKSTPNSRTQCMRCSAPRSEAVSGAAPLPFRLHETERGNPGVVSQGASTDGGQQAAAAASSRPDAVSSSPDTTQAMDDLPALDDIFRRWRPLVRHIPRRARDLWASLLAAELRGAAQAGDDRAWKRVHLLAHCCLWLPAHGVRGGSGASRGSQSLHRLLERRLRQWEQGNWRELWRDLLANAGDGERSQRQGLAAAARRAKRKAAEGQWAKACQCRDSAGVYDMTDEVVKALGDLHPPGPPVPAPATELPEALQFSQDQVNRALASFPRDAAGGATGLTPQHLLDAVGCPSPVTRELALQSLTSVVNVLAAGEVPLELAPFLAGAPLTALRKESEQGALQVRPIAVGGDFAARRRQVPCAA